MSHHPREDAHGHQAEVWHRSLTSGWMLAVGVVSAPALLVAAAVVDEYRSIALWLLVVPVAFLATGAIRVTVSRRGVTVASLLLPFLRRRFALDRIRQASARWTRPTEIGGWGYRWSPGLSAVSLREGDALWLTLTDDNRFVITVDDADTAARLVNRLGQAAADSEGR
ncbi:hypothetical protein V1L54_25145 [Streptomyces sp. TRM 70361]|uniref:hypothetical protein n=1 Tax=Streptomyces sp. TRM 70361 TaxID=3116553 RepID=UPI002E7B5401|nr:hypothetical protein [Streptomyces sp. TRM 70361]MEE1942652.1 hypothetical protein [Streptomyces sp. TRM 70361]